jgi:hypothetical protein
VETDEAGRDTGVGDAGILDNAPDDVARAWARAVVEGRAQPGAMTVSSVAQQ